jgi:signal transduction histidine kinase
VLEAERRAREEQALREAAGAVSAAFTVEEMLPRIARSALEATEANGSMVERLDAAGKQLHIVAVAGDVRLHMGESVPYAGSYAEQVIQRGEPMIIPRLAAAERIPRHWAETCPDCSALVLGLMEAGEVIGALLLLRSPGSPPFRASEIARGRTFAELVSLAFRKVHLLEESERRREELEQVMESRARLMRGFSHDVKNPLSASLGYVELLREGFMGARTPEQDRALERVRAGIGAAVRLIDDLVDLARAESGQIEISPEMVDLRHAVHEMIGQYAAAAEQKSLNINSDVPTSQAPVWTDPVRVRQVLGNLLSNAVKYTPAGGGIDVRIVQPTTRREGGNGPWIALHVIDSGPGIAPEDQERIFNEFTRLAPGAAEGAGLGLSISRRIARLLGGDLTVESEAGQGSNFTLWLPLSRAGERSESPGAGAGDADTPGAAAD